MLANVAEDCEAQAPELKVERQIAADIRANADPDLLEQALQNLATNAVKYNRPDGSVRFDLFREGEHVFVHVSNTGSQIPPADWERIFERFYRADPSRSGRVDGAGLGLSLAREIIRAHGGDLTLAVSEHDLTRFVVMLPAAT